MFELSVALRFLKEGRTQTLLILTGIAFGIAVQVFLNSLITGLQKDLVQRTVGTSPHITAALPEQLPQPPLFADNGEVIAARIVGISEAPRSLRNWQPVYEQLLELPQVTAVSAEVDGSAFISKAGRVFPVVLKGLDLATADEIYDIQRRVYDGSGQLQGNTVLVGRELAEDLRINPGGTVRIENNAGNAAVFTVVGFFDLENQALNETWVILSLKGAQSFFNTQGGISKLGLQVEEVFDAEGLAAGLEKSFPELSWVSWQENNRNLLSALRSQGSSSLIIQVLVLVAVTLGIASVLAVSAIQKSKQIGIMKALGAKRSQISRIFLIQGAILGFCGSLIGTVAGLGLVRSFIVLTSRGGGSLFPLSFSWQAFLTSVVIATVAGTLAAAFPARRSAGLDPIEVIRNG